jgi:hypothetical protein
MELRPTKRANQVQPFLTRYASKRSSAPELQGYYSHELSMWAIGTDLGEVPMIDRAQVELELVTKTMVEHERDDESLTCGMSELLTKTDVRTEQDDTSTFVCLELATKTEAQMEHDDTSHQTAGLFI